MRVSLFHDIVTLISRGNYRKRRWIRVGGVGDIGDYGRWSWGLGWWGVFCEGLRGLLWGTAQGIIMGALFVERTIMLETRNRIKSFGREIVEVDEGSEHSDK